MYKSKELNRIVELRKKANEDTVGYYESWKEYRNSIPSQKRELVILYCDLEYELTKLHELICDENFECDKDALRAEKEVLKHIRYDVLADGMKFVMESVLNDEND